MATPRKRRTRKKHVRGKIKLSQRMQLVRKDKLRVAKEYPEAFVETRTPNNAATFRVKLRRK